MYSVRTYEGNVFKSWHQETQKGLERAIREADMRTHGFGVGHIVTDNHGLRLYLSLPDHVEKKLREERKAWRDRMMALVISAAAGALLLHAIFSPR